MQVVITFHNSNISRNSHTTFIYHSHVATKPVYKKYVTQTTGMEQQRCGRASYAAKNQELLECMVYWCVDDHGLTLHWIPYMYTANIRFQTAYYTGIVKVKCMWICIARLCVNASNALRCGSQCYLQTTPYLPLLPVAEHHHPLAGTHCAYPRRDGQAELTWGLSWPGTDIHMCNSQTKIREKPN